MDEAAEGPIFRANKRRKVFRKRAESDANDYEPHVATSLQPDRVPLASANTGTITGDEDAASRSDIARVRKPKKHGIAFSSSDRSSSRPHNDNEENALIVLEPQPEEQQNGRFMRQTGKAIVEDDKHMSAYIDSKLAELRYGSATPNTATQQPSHAPTNELSAEVQAQLSPVSTGLDSTPQPPFTHPITKPTIASTSKPSARRHGRTQRQPSPSTTARASLIDQIMRESNHTPHYTPTLNASSSNTTGNGKHLDPDAAAAEAFKADFLAQAEARNLSRRQPAVNASAGSAGAAGAVPSGPKLGGSRAARERMRAMEEAKGKK